MQALSNESDSKMISVVRAYVWEEEIYSTTVFFLLFVTNIVCNRV